MRHLRVVSSTLLVLAALAGAETGDAPRQPVREYTTIPTRTITMPDSGAGQVARVTLFVTEDGGHTWRKDQELPVAENASALPPFSFTAPRDGAFGLWTVATMRSGSSEAEPVSGAAPKLELVVDRAAPDLELLEATLGGIADSQATLAISWRVSDPNLTTEPVSIEVSLDQGKVFTAEQQGAASGTTALSVPVTASTAELQVRVVARDLAGNVLTSPATPVLIPASARPSDPEAALAAAVAALPNPGELGVVGRSGSPMVTSGENPLATAAPAPTDTAPATNVVQQTADEPDQPASMPDESEIIANSDVEARYARAAGSPVEQPRGRRSNASPAVVDEPAVSADGRSTVADPSLPFLVGSAASAALERARSAEQAGDVDTALALYLRLHRSSLAKTALEDGLGLLRRIGDDATIIGIVHQLPPELRTDAARLNAARAYLHQGDAANAAAWSAKVRSNASEAREAMLILGQALQSLGRNAEARRLYEVLAGGDDEIAAQARALRF